MPFTVGRAEDTLFEVRMYHLIERTKTWEELAYAICKLVYTLITRRTWRE
jgi:hypothetical protein